MSFDPEVARAEATENQFSSKGYGSAVNRVVKWFILILVIVFDPLAVTLVIAYNASLRKKDEVGSLQEPELEQSVKAGSGFLSLAISLVLIVLGTAGFIYYQYSAANHSEANSAGIAKASLMGELSARRIDDRAFPRSRKGFGYAPFRCANVGRGRAAQIVSDDLSARIPFLGDLAWDPQSCGVEPMACGVFPAISGGEFKDHWHPVTSFSDWPCRSRTKIFSRNSSFASLTSNRFHLLEDSGKLFSGLLIHSTQDKPRLHWNG